MNKIAIIKRDVKVVCMMISGKTSRETSHLTGISLAIILRASKIYSNKLIAKKFPGAPTATGTTCLKKDPEFWLKALENLQAELIEKEKNNPYKTSSLYGLSINVKK